MNKLYAVDVETTGLNPKESSIVSIGAVNIYDPEDHFYIECNAWKGSTIDSVALKINGFALEEVVDNPDKTDEAGAVGAFLTWLGESPMMIAHNATFDRDFIAAACKRADLKSPFGFRTIDIHSIMQMHLIRAGKDVPKVLSLNKCLELCGFEKEPNPHNALTGAVCNRQVFIHIMNHSVDNEG